MRKIMFDGGKLFHKSWDTGCVWALLCEVPAEIATEYAALKWYYANKDTPT